MNRIILQPVANKLSYEHYKDTVLNAVPITVIEKYVDPILLEEIKEQYPDGNVYMWGIEDKKNTKKNWGEIKRGDIVLFSKKGASCIIQI